MAAIEEYRMSDQSPAADFDAIHKLPRSWRYFNISVIWIFYYESVVRVFYRMRVRHEVVTFLSIGCGLIAAWMIVSADSLIEFLLVAVLVHLKDLFDACDGALARMTGTGHRLGRFLDTIGDGVVFTAWIAVCAFRGITEGVAPLAAIRWATVTWLSLFLQCSYFNFHQLHYVRLSGAELTSRLDERGEHSSGVVSVLAWIYDLWFGWQDWLIAWLDRIQRGAIGLPAFSLDRRNDDWYTRRLFMVANSVLCFGTHALILIICLVFQSPLWFLPIITVGLNIYWLGIVLARLVVFRKRA